MLQILRRGLTSANVQCEFLACTSVDAGMYNKNEQNDTSKSALNFSIAMQHVNRIIQKFPAEHPRIMIDRHGGRIQYRNDLQLCWPRSTHPSPR